jgi:PAS domain S-box-containing protein
VHRMFPLRHLLGAATLLLLALAALLVGIVVSAQIRIVDLATDTRDRVLPVISARQEVSHDVERLILFGEELLNSADPAKRRQARLGAQALVYNEAGFRADPEIGRVGRETLQTLNDLVTSLERRDVLRRESYGLLLAIGHGSELQTAASSGRRLDDLVADAMAMDSPASVDELRQRIATAMHKGGDGPSGLARKVDRLLDLRHEIIRIDDANAKAWAAVTNRLKVVTDTLATQAQLLTSERFSEIQQQADYVRKVAFASLAVLVGMLLLFVAVAHRLLVRPLVQATGSLERALKGEEPLHLADSRIAEIASILAAATMLRDSQQRLRAAQQYARIGYWELQKNAEVGIWTDQVYEILGLPHSYPASLESLVGVADAADRAAIIDSVGDSLQRGTELRNEWRIRRHEDGALRWIECRGRPVLADDGTVDRIVGFVQDVTERKRQQHEIEELNRSLEARVGERTEALAQANRELEAFAFSVSHDLRAPLRAIDGFAHLLEHEAAAQLSADARHMLDRILESARKMDTLIIDLLKFSRAGRGEMQSDRVDMADLVRSVVDELKAECGQCVVRVGELPPANGDRALLRQVWSNLIGNALKYSSKTENAAVDIGALDVRGETAYFIRDNGVGFDPAYAGKLFGVFQRLHSEDEFPGTGVGLAIVKRIVERHGGRVWAEAQPQRGACFCFTLAAASPAPGE